MVLQNSGNNTLSSGLKVALGSDAAGDVYYRNSAGLLTRIPAPGAAGNALVYDITNGMPAWALTADASITFDKLQDIASGSFLARDSAGSGVIEELTVTEARALLELGTAALVNTGITSGTVPLLDVNGQLANSMIPSISIFSFYGTVADQAARLALTATDVQQNDAVKQSDNGLTYVLTDADPTVNANWTPIGDATIVASDIVSGIIATARLGTGTADSNSVLFGDQVYRPLPPTSFPVVNVTGATQQMEINTRYRAARSAGVCTLTLPTTSVDGDVVHLMGVGAGGWTVAQGASQQIFYGDKSTTPGGSGQINSTHQRDSFILECIVANTTWQVQAGGIGNVDIV